MRVGKGVDGLGLQSAGRVALLGELADAREQQIAGEVRLELQGRIASEHRDLAGEAIGRVLVAEDGVGGALALALIEVVTEEIALPIHDQTGCARRIARVIREVGMQAAAVGNLEGLLRGAEDQGQPVGVVDQVIEIAERLDLV